MSLSWQDDYSVFKSLNHPATPMTAPDTVFPIAADTLIQNRKTGGIATILSEPKARTRQGRQYVVVNCFFHSGDRYGSLQVSQVFKDYRPTGLRL